MPDLRRKWKILLLHTVMLPTLLFAFYFFTLSPRSWEGVDEAVVEKIAKEHGREAKAPVLDMGSDLLLFAFLVAGAAGGFAAGYYWRQLVKKD